MRGRDLHVVAQRNLPVLVPNDWEPQLASRNLVDVLDPATMALDRVGAQTDELDSTLGELWLELRKGSQLGRADRRVVLGVREKDNPAIADELALS